MTTNKSWAWVNKGASQGSFLEPQKGAFYWETTQMLTNLTTFKKAEAVDATPQDLSIVLRWAGSMRFLAGPATLD
ncbi:MAG: hypothetical protein PUP93_04200 [Rhizonema sp. NSF051]|nr:hypothetical protein [Rhizonema sp. NSF051]